MRASRPDIGGLPAKLHYLILAGLRRLSRFSPAKTAALNAAKVAPGRFQCAACKETFRRPEVNVDHIEPVIDPATGFVDWNTYIKRLFCSISGLQVLCSADHDKKTQAENKIRRTK